MANYGYGGGGLSSIPPMVKSLIIINVIVFIFQQVVPGLTQWGELHYWSSPFFKPHQIVTMMFLHGGIWHVGFNMLALYIAGSTLENFWGSKRFFNFYMLCGIAASVITLLTIPLSGAQSLKHLEHLQGVTATAEETAQYMSQYYQAYSALGASGAIMGAMAAFAYLFPNTELYIYGMFPVKVKYLVPGYIAIDLFGGLGYQAMQGDNIAHWAHIGGALTGLLIVVIWNKTNRRTLY
jgi:membrane associated rhomboid family serine protease